MADSQFAVDYLNKELNIDLNSHLTEEQKAVAQAFRRMFEEASIWYEMQMLKEECAIMTYHVELT